MCRMYLQGKRQRKKGKRDILQRSRNMFVWNQLHCILSLYFFPPYKTNQLISLSFQTGLVRCPANNSISIKMINSMIAYRHSLSVLEHFPRSYGKHVNKLLCYFRNNLYIIHFLNNGTEKLHLCSTFLWK